MAAQRTCKEETLIFLGTGTSSSIPVIGCLTRQSPCCKVCLSSIQPDSKNRRRNTSALVRVRTPDGVKNILIDAGKTFYESALLVFPKYGLRQIDALLLSHNHCDAANGLDDLRGWTLGGFVQEYIDVYCDQATFHSVRTMFPFLVDISKATGGGDVVRFKWHVIDPIEPFQIEAGGIQVQALQVEHGFYSSGLPYYCLGFRIGEFSYISDTSAVPERTKTLLHGTKVLVLDALRDKPHPSHFSINQALGFVKSLHPPPLQTYLTGFSHDVNHYELEKRLVKDTSINITPCFDGQKVELDYC